MMYILKFILLWLLPPGFIVLLLAALTFYLFKRKAAGKFAAALITLLLYFASLMPTAQLLTHGLESRYTQQSAVKADAVAVLGGGAVSGVPDIDGNGAKRVSCFGSRQFFVKILQFRLACFKQLVI